MKPNEIGVCSWSLAMSDTAQMLEAVKSELGLNVVQFGCMDDQVVADGGVDQLVDVIQASGVQVSATCVAFAGEDYASIQKIAETGGLMPDGDIENRFKKIAAVSQLTEKLGLDKLMFHMGFVPHEAGAVRQKMIDRARRTADMLGEKNQILLMETGQEKATSLAEYIAAVDRANVKVNFDPANMVLYGAGEPVEAMEILKDHIAHVHMKDATWSDDPGNAWGAEVPLGQGQADIPAVVNKLKQIGYTGPLVIEREAGDARIADIQSGAELLRQLTGQ
jgi:sugar phosphate isomerase/epimerase